MKCNRIKLLISFYKRLLISSDKPFDRYQAQKRLEELVSQLENSESKPTQSQLIT